MIRDRTKKRMEAVNAIEGSASKKRRIKDTIIKEQTDEIANLREENRDLKDDLERERKAHGNTIQNYTLRIAQLEDAKQRAEGRLGGMVDWVSRDCRLAPKEASPESPPDDAPPPEIDSPSIMDFYFPQ